MQTTYGLEMAGGVYKNPGFTGTAFIAKFRQSDGTLVKTDINVTGPTGWNTGLPFSLIFSPGSWGIDYSWDSSIGAVAGTYQATTTVNAIGYSSSFQIDPASSIEPATNVTTSAVTKTQADVAWTAPTGSKGYTVTIFQNNNPQADTIVPGANFRTDKPSIQFRTISLDPTKKYYIVVRSTNASWSPDNPPLPLQFNLSRVTTTTTFSPLP